VAGGADVIGMAGGDGSQALVAGVAARHGVGFVWVPAGTRGEALVLDPPIEFRTLPGALRVRIPLTAAGRPVALGSS
jgi:diacylglycerol kinase family enzyme